MHKPREVTYSVVEERLERRSDQRRPARLQAGKILDGDERFLTEFVFRNRSEGGVRLRLAHRVVLPKRILLFDDQCAALRVATVVWQRGCDAGCRLATEHAPAPEPLLARLRNRYYAIG
ncbi:PilZ domain-containing protein [Methylosinus trichosporium]|uniref:PilZ domain-containing protein n=1 Tax=Methylosinus TaxID=425 RepID=UPI0012DCA07C|nr:PilZ domain-containing protein [Methylosinus trichosporium]